MRVALIADEVLLHREQASLNRQCIALLDAGVQLVRMVPSTFDPLGANPLERELGLVPRISYSKGGPIWLRPSRRAALLYELDRHAPDVIHASGASTFALASDLARTLDRPLVLQAWSSADVAAVPRHTRTTPAIACVAPTAPLAALLGTRVDPAIVHHIAIGVAVPPQLAVDAPASDTGVDLVVLTEGLDPESTDLCFAGLQRAIAQHAELHAVIEIRGPRSHDTWRSLRRHGLLELTTSIADAAPLRQLVLCCHVVVTPERAGVVRGLVLEAMAAGITVIARADSMLDMIEPERTAIVVGSAGPSDGGGAPSAERWQVAFERALGSGEDVEAIARGGRALIERQHRSCDHAERLIDLYERIGGPEALPFPGAVRPD